MKKHLLAQLSWPLVLLLSVTLSATQLAAAQAPLEVVVVASSHVNQEPADDYRPVIDKLKAYQPDMVFSENVTAAEMQQLPNESYARLVFMPRYQYVRRHNPTAKPLSASATAKANKALAGFPYYHKTRIDLARSYVLGYDRANAEYQLYVLEQHMKSRFGKGELAYYNTVFGGSDSLLLKKLVRPNSEYQKIFFPLIYELKQPQMYAMDCQQYDKAWELASGQTIQQIKALKARVKADSTLPEVATVKKMTASLAAYSNFWGNLDTSLAVYQAMNSPRYDLLDEAVNFYGGQALYGAPGFPTDAVKAMKAQWQLRNEGMCANVVRQAREQGAKRVIVAVGSSHGQTMLNTLNQTPGVKAISFAELP